MAASLLRFGAVRHLKCLQLECCGVWYSGGTVRSHSVASFCTQAEDPAKPAKNTIAASKTADAPDERATLLAYKTSVAFPDRFSQPGIFLAQSLGVAESVASSIAIAETGVIARATSSTTDDAFTVITASSNPGDPGANESSSSSSSDSDSDTDSDSEDEKSKFKAETKTSPPHQSGSAVKIEAKVQQIRTKVKEKHHNNKEDAPSRASESVLEATPVAVAATLEAAQASAETPDVSSEELVDSAPEICTAVQYPPEVRRFKGPAEAASAAHDAQTQTPANVGAEPATCEKAPTDVPIGTTHPAPAEASAVAEAMSVEVTAKTATEISPPVESQKELVGCASAIAEAAGEARVALSEEAAAAAPPEPEQPFDNSTYKNYQHHSYTAYTFVDLDVDMAKFRLPQPSSGRPSPRH